MRNAIGDRPLLLLLAACLGGPAVQAETRTFTNGALDSDWFSPGNWDPNGAPSPSDELVVTGGVPTTVALVEVSDGGSVLIEGPTAGAALDQLQPGRSGSGVFTVRGGGDLTTASFVRIGWFDGSSGDMVLTGDGTTWVADSLVSVGLGSNTSANATGALTISDLADFDGLGLEIGGRPAATGTLTVDNASATTSGTIIVGAFGFGAASVNNGGALESTGGSVTVGSGAIGEGELYVDGGTVTAALGMLVGSSGVGLLDVRNGGAVRVDANTVMVAATAGSSGRAVVDGEGSTFTAEGGVQVGNRDLGSFEVTGGADVSSGSAFFGVFGETADGYGLIDGAGSTWTTTGQTSVGYESVGLLELANGGRFNGWQTLLGDRATGVGELYVRDGGAYDGSDVLYVGFQGFGSLTVETGGAVENDGRGAIGVSAGAEGDAVVSGAGSVWDVNNELLVGWSGLGLLTVLDGGVVNSDTGIIAQGIGSVGDAVVSGAGAQWNNANDLSVGSLGQGLLLVTEGGKVTAVNGLVATSTDASGSAFVGDLSPGVESTTTAVWELSDSLYVGGPSFGAAGPGDLTVGANGEVRVANETVVWSTGELQLEGGVLKTGELDISTAGAFRFTGGTLTADAVTGDLLNEGGTVAPGASPGPMTIAGDYTQLGAAELQIELGGLTPDAEHDQLIVDGATLDLAGTLELVHLAGFDVRVGDLFDVITFTGTRNGTFDAVNARSEEGLRVEVGVIYGAGVVTVEVISITPPLPGDYNGDGAVDAADFTVWRDNEGAPAGTLPNDVDGGVIGAAQYNTWAANFGAADPVGDAVPETSSGALLLLAALSARGRRRQSTRS